MLFKGTVSTVLPYPLSYCTRAMPKAYAQTTFFQIATKSYRVEVVKRRKYQIRNLLDLIEETYVFYHLSLI